LSDVVKEACNTTISCVLKIAFRARLYLTHVDVLEFFRKKDSLNIFSCINKFELDLETVELTGLQSADVYRTRISEE